jgi:hypothetical protein
MRKIKGPSDGKSSHCLWQGELKSMTIGGRILTSKNIHDD